MTTPAFQIYCDFAAQDELARRRSWRLALAALLGSALFIAALIGPYLYIHRDRISEAVACSERVI